MVKNLGCHTSHETISELCKYTHLFQIFLGSPMRFELDKEVLLERAKEFTAHTSCEFVVHGPYWINIQAPNRFIKQSTVVLAKHLRAASICNFPYVVTHTGTRHITNKKTKEEIVYTEEESCDFMYKTLIGMTSYFDQYKNVKLLLENTASPKEKGLSVDKIIEVVNRLKMAGIHSVGLCFDVEHAYARGEDVSKFEEYMQFADVIHFNSVPAKIVPGKGLDRHSETSLYESVGILPERYLEWLKRFEDKPKILEMEFAVSVNTFEWLKNMEVLNESNVPVR